METIFYTLIIIFILKHFLVDFLLQPRLMAVGKGTSAVMLTTHCIIHWIFMTLIVLLINLWLIPISPIMLIFIPLYDFVTHWGIDFATSRIKIRKNYTVDKKQFWNMIGLDQALHYLVYLLIISFIV